MKDEAICLRTLGATIVVLIVKAHSKLSASVYLSERWSMRGFIDATIMIRYNATDWNEATAHDTSNDFCEGQWYSEADSVVAVLDIDNRMHRRVISYDDGIIGGVLSMMKTTREGISIRHDLLQ